MRAALAATTSRTASVIQPVSVTGGCTTGAVTPKDASSAGRNSRGAVRQPPGCWSHPAGPGLQIAPLGEAGGGLRGAPVVLVRAGRVAVLLQQMRAYGEQPVMPGHPLVTVQCGPQRQPGQRAPGLGR